VAPFGCHYPGPHLPGRRVTDVEGVAAFELRDPLLLFILMKPDDALLHHCALSHPVA
jgi:hypothetical protein